MQYGFCLLLTLVRIRLPIFSSIYIKYSIHQFVKQIRCIEIWNLIPRRLESSSDVRHIHPKAIYCTESTKVSFFHRMTFVCTYVIVTCLGLPLLEAIMFYRFISVKEKKSFCIVLNIIIFDKLFLLNRLIELKFLKN